MSPKPRRMDGYIRVSRVGARDVESESYITEAVQRDKIETWARLRGVEIAAWHVDRDQSGSRLTRPGFDAAMARIRSGATEGIVVAQIDRLSRADVADALMIVREIHDEHGGTVAAVDLGIDPTTEVGEMLLTVLLALARMQWRRYRAAWSAAKARAIKRGAHVGPTPVGYQRGADGRLQPDPDTAAYIRSAFRVAGVEGLSAATQFLAGAGLTTNRRHPRTKQRGEAMTWTTTLARRVLTSRVYLGEIRNGDGGCNSEAHEPLVDLATFTAAQRRINAGAQRYRQPGQFPLSGHVVCGTCGDRLVGKRTGDTMNRAYRCRHNNLGAVQKGEEPACSAPAMVTASALEEYVRAALVDYVASTKPDEEVALVQGSDSGAVERAETALRSAEERAAQDARDLNLSADMLALRMEAHDRAIAEAQELYAAAVEEAQPELTWPLVDEIVAAPAGELPGLLERCNLVVTVAPGKGNLPERVALTERS